MADQEQPRSQLDAFLSTPMGPGLDSERGAPVELRDQPGQGSRPSAGSKASMHREAAAADPTAVAPGEALGSEIASQRVDLSDASLLSPPPPASDPDGAGNEQADARLAEARAQGGQAERSAPDQTRGAGREGSITDTDGV